MNKVIEYLALKSSHRFQVWFLMGVISCAYFYNFHVNDIWTPNESFYAESVREMFESGNFLDINYNYEPRYNKPPLTYWVIAISSSIFGLNEFSIRLPIVIMALGAIWLTYLLGKEMYGQKGGLYALVIIALGLQILAVKQYASPEIPLTFFFTLTMYWFYKGFKKRSNSYLIGSYIALGLTVLTKGFPYIIVIGGIIGVYVLLKNWGNWKQLWKDTLFLKLPLGLLIVFVIGLSWVIFMYIRDGQDFWEIYYRETFGRALEKKSNGLKPFFYIGVISWSIVPYSLTFFYSIIYWFKHRTNVKEILFPIAWLVVMLIIFTISKGKIPTYIIQAHPALALIIVPMFLDTKSKHIGLKAINLTMSALLIVGTVYLIFILDLSRLFLLTPFLIVVLSIISAKRIGTLELSKLLPFWGMLGFVVIFSSFLPRMEKLRPYDEIGQVINTNVNINSATPIYIESTLIHNIPFYAKRKAIRDATPDILNNTSGQTMALVKTENLSEYHGFQSLWTGMIYDFPSESQFFKFVMACLEAESGDYSKFAEFQLIFKE
jgi:4-amino-4-deoxy-L-arabinose transferase-like glycosyltransferase